DLRTFETQPGHQPRLAEWKRIDVVPDGRRRGALGRTLVHYHDARSRSDRPAVMPVEIGDRLVGHQEQRVAVGLAAGLQAVGNRADLVIAGRLAFHEEN